MHADVNTIQIHQVRTQCTVTVSGVLGFTGSRVNAESFALAKHRELGYVVFKSIDGKPAKLWAVAKEGAPRGPYAKPSPGYVLKYREPGKRKGNERWATRPVAGVRDAVEWMNQNKSIAFLPAFVQTNAWKPETVAILG